MSIKEFISDKKLVEYLDQKVNALLNQHRIFTIHSYGWVDSENENPEYIGLAMWELEPPNAEYIESLIDGNEINYSPTKIDNILATSGNDFYGLMDISRLSIGLCLLFEELAL